MNTSLNVNPMFPAIFPAHGQHIKTTPRGRTLNTAPRRLIVRCERTMNGASIDGIKRLGHRPEHKGGAK